MCGYVRWYERLFWNIVRPLCPKCHGLQHVQESNDKGWTCDICYHSKFEGRITFLRWLLWRLTTPLDKERE